MNNEYKNKMSTWADRREPVKNKKLKPKPDGSHLVKYEEEVEYKYYICDYCGEEIRIANKWENKTGGIAELPNSLTNRGKVKIAVHNRCLRLLLKEIEEEGIS